jgi:RHS repeat-associated protein
MQKTQDHLTDANYNVTALVDTSGAVQERYVYDPYGAVTVCNADWTERTSGTMLNKVLFQGMYYDTETGLYHVRHRMYHPTLGRWLQRDPLGYVDGLHLYDFAGNAPTVSVDPAGLQDHKVRLTVTRTSSHGSVEAYTGDKSWWKGNYNFLYSIPEEASFFTYPSESSWANIEMQEAGTQTLWLASLRVWTKHGEYWAGWTFQMSATYAWDVAVDNMCCMSERIAVKARGAGGPTASYSLPPSATHSVPVGESKRLERASFGAAWIQTTEGTMRTYASLRIDVSCEE